MIDSEIILEKLLEKFPWLREEVRKIKEEQEQQSSRDVSVYESYNEPGYERELSKRVRNGEY